MHKGDQKISNPSHLYKDILIFNFKTTLFNKMFILWCKNKQYCWTRKLAIKWRRFHSRYLWLNFLLIVTYFLPFPLYQSCTGRHAEWRSCWNSSSPQHRHQQRYRHVSSPCWCVSLSQHRNKTQPSLRWTHVTLWSQTAESTTNIWLCKVLFLFRDHRLWFNFKTPDFKQCLIHTWLSFKKDGFNSYHIVIFSSFLYDIV